MSSRCIKWYKLVSVQNGSSGSKSFPWNLGLFDSSTTQSQVSPAFCSLSGVTISIADTTMWSWNNSASSWFIFVFLLVVLLNQRVKAFVRICYRWCEMKKFPHMIFLLAPSRIDCRFSVKLFITRCYIFSLSIRRSFYFLFNWWMPLV